MIESFFNVNFFWYRYFFQRRILSVTMSPCPAKSSAIHVIGKTPPYHGSYDSTRPLPASDCTTLLDTVQVPNVACVREGTSYCFIYTLEC